MNKVRQEVTMLVSIIGDEDTVTGMLLTGLGERNLKGETNFFKVDTSTNKLFMKTKNVCTRLTMLIPHE